MAWGRDAVDRVCDAVAANPSLAAKQQIALVGRILRGDDWLSGPGDDGAAIRVGDNTVIACGEALWPPFVAADPYGSGVAAVLANVNDLAAMGAEPLAIVDTITGTSATAQAVLEGMRWASELYRVPIVGGHLTLTEGTPSVSAFAVGSADTVLSTTRVCSGQDLVVAACLDGHMRTDFPFFTSLEERGQQLGDDVRLLAHIANQGLASAAKDISMAGLIGSLAMLLEWSGCGVLLDLDRVPCPRDVPLEEWCNCFPAFGFLLTCESAMTDACCAAFQSAGLSAANVGTLDNSGSIALESDGYTRQVIDVRQTPATGLPRP